MADGIKSKVMTNGGGELPEYEIIFKRGKYAERIIVSHRSSLIFFYYYIINRKDCQSFWNIYRISGIMW